MTGTVTRIGSEAEPEQDAVERFTAPQVLAIIDGLTYRQLDWWCTAGRVPTQPRRPGSGHARVFTADEIDLLHAVWSLLQVGFTVDAAFATAHYLLEHGELTRSLADTYTLTVRFNQSEGETAGEVT